jgi:nucleotide-binding universal stress UspA family protein
LSLEKNLNIDLIVVPNKRKNVFARFFNPGLAHRILTNADLPLLVIRV